MQSVLRLGDVGSDNLNTPEQLLQGCCLESGRVEDPLGHVLEMRLLNMASVRSSASNVISVWL